MWTLLVVFFMAYYNLSPNTIRINGVEIDDREYQVYAICLNQKEAGTESPNEYLNENRIFSGFM